MSKLFDKPGRVIIPALINSPDDHLHLAQYASEVLKAAGFILAATSLKSEACYYKLPNKPALLRVAAHRTSRTENRLMSEPVIANITFAPKNKYCMEAVRHIINYAVGKYFLYPLTTGEDGTIPLPPGIPMIRDQKRRHRHALEKIHKLKEQNDDIF